MIEIQLICNNINVILNHFFDIRKKVYLNLKNLEVLTNDN